MIVAVVAWEGASRAELLDPVLPGLLQLLLSRAIVREKHYSRLVRDDDDVI